MGIWGPLTFENDYAWDYTADLTTTRDLSNEIEGMIIYLKEFASRKGMLEYYDSVKAMCIIEIIVAVKSGQISNLPDRIIRRINRSKRHSVVCIFFLEEEYQLALYILVKILLCSELMNWEEQDYCVEWYQNYVRLYETLRLE